MPAVVHCPRAVEITRDMFTAVRFALLLHVL